MKERRTIEEIYKDWSRGVLPDTNELIRLTDETNRAITLAKLFNAGRAVEDFYFRHHYSMEQALQFRRHR